MKLNVSHVAPSSAAPPRQSPDVADLHCRSGSSCRDREINSSTQGRPSHAPHIHTSPHIRPCPDSASSGRKAFGTDDVPQGCHKAKTHVRSWQSAPKGRGQNVQSHTGRRKPRRRNAAAATQGGMQNEGMRDAHRTSCRSTGALEKLGANLIRTCSREIDRLFFAG